MRTLTRNEDELNTQYVSSYTGQLLVFVIALCMLPPRACMSTGKPLVQVRGCFRCTAHHTEAVQFVAPRLPQLTLHGPFTCNGVVCVFCCQRLAVHWYSCRFQAHVCDFVALIVSRAKGIAVISHKNIESHQVGKPDYFFTINDNDEPEEVLQGEGKVCRSLSLSPCMRQSL